MNASTAAETFPSEFNDHIALCCLVTHLGNSKIYRKEFNIKGTRS